MTFIGDLSIKDAELLSQYSQHKDVMEFGSGGSTQVFDKHAKSILSIETDPNWIDAVMPLTKKARYWLYENYISVINKYDVIYVDGEWSKRFDFAKNTWKNLKEGGSMLFHDTRREKDRTYVEKFIKFIGSDFKVVWNENHSNITVIKKELGSIDETNKFLEYENWNKAEGKEDWMCNALLERPHNWKQILNEADKKANT